MSKTTYVRQGETADFSFLNGFLARLREKRRFVYLTTVVGSILTLIILLLTPNRYIATTRLIPEGGGGGDEIAAMAARVVPGGIFRNAVMSNLKTEGGNLSALASSNRVADSVLFRTYTNPADGRTGNLMELWGQSNIEAARRTLLSLTTVSHDAKSNVLSISAETTDPSFSAQIAANVASELDKFRQEIDRANARKMSDYYQQRMAEADVLLAKSEEDQKRFLSRNMNYRGGDDPELNLTVMRLEAEVLFHRKQVAGLRQLKTMADMEAASNISRFVVMEKAEPPLLKSGPPRTRNQVLYTLASVLFAVGLLLLRFSYEWYFPQTTRAELTDSITFVRKDVSRAVNRMREPFRIKEKPRA